MTVIRDVLQKGWDILSDLGLVKTASILRYTTTNDGKPYIGVAPTQTLVAGLADLEAFVTQVSVREVAASQGKLELSDLLFVFRQEIQITDRIDYGGKIYRPVEVRYYDPTVLQCQVVGRAV